MQAAMNRLVKRCEAIAKANRDEFRYRIELDVNRRTAGFLYNVVVEETGDGHTFVNGSALNLEDAINEALDAITDECETWGYTEPKYKDKGD